MFVISPKVFGIPCTGEYGGTGVPIVGENPGHSVGDVDFLYFVLCVKKEIFEYNLTRSLSLDLSTVVLEISFTSVHTPI
jgi:hypothetical protein